MSGKTITALGWAICIAYFVPKILFTPAAKADDPFTDAKVVGLKQEIAETIERQRPDWKVTSVTLAKDSEGMSGVAHIKTPDFDFDKKCRVTMPSDTYLWHCQ